MPELGILRPTGLVAPLFSPTVRLGPSTPPEPAIDTSALSAAQANASALKSITDATAALPSSIIQNYQAGKKLAIGAAGDRLKQNILSGQIAPGDLQNLGQAGVNIGADGSISIKPPSPLETALNQMRLQTGQSREQMLMNSLQIKQANQARLNAIQVDDAQVAPNTPAEAPLPTSVGDSTIDLSTHDSGTPVQELQTTPGEDNLLLLPSTGVPTSSNGSLIQPGVTPDAQSAIANAASTAGAQIGAINPALNAMDSSGVAPATGFTAATNGAPGPAPLDLATAAPQADPYKLFLGDQKPILGDAQSVEQAPPTQDVPGLTPSKTEVDKAVPAMGDELPTVKTGLKQGLRWTPDKTSVVYYKDGVVTHFATVTPQGGMSQLKPYQYPPGSIEGQLLKKGYNPALMTPQAVQKAMLGIRDPLKPDTLKDLTARRIPTFDAATGTLISNSEAIAKLKADDEATGRSSLTDAKNIFDVEKSFTGSNQYRNAYQQASSYNNFNAAFEAAKKTKNGMADVALLDAFLKTQNPGAIVRQSTANMVLKAQPLLEKYMPAYLAGKLTSGTFLTDKDRTDMKRVMDEEIDENKKYFAHSTMEPHVNALKQMGGKPTDIVSPYDYFANDGGATKAAPYTMQSPLTVTSQADYDSAPSGTWVRDSQGRVGKKP